MQIEILCVGKLKEKFWVEACAEYGKRLSRFCRLHITEVKDEAVGERVSDAQLHQAMEKEGERLLALLWPRDYVVSLCVEGCQISSESLADKITQIQQMGSGRLVLIIGGSNGLSKEVKARSNYCLSFSAMTFPHQLMRVVLLEQIYRAFKINAGENYHK
ncbi:MAG: 23S rRNA (pseudouridine(1915)-N(3))-methyltransferase RlmH [Ruminococcaceae bacterium]|nr:23S rRNA (pseudouridine(1915)-N(3))-methyltransferase RlmH [Oscillospiraceae bacterium]